MLAGPVFSRELVAAPRRVRLYAERAAYAGGLLVLIISAWQVLTGARVIRHPGDLAKFAALIFQLLAPLQLGVTAFLAAISTAVAVAEEKDRGTMTLLLLSRLRPSELVLGRLFASLLGALMMVAAGLPVFTLLALLGGISFDQIARITVVTVAAVVGCGTLGSTIALWRDRTYQAVAMTVLAAVLWTAVWEAVDRGALGAYAVPSTAQRAAAIASPWHAALIAARPQLPGEQDATRITWMFALAVAAACAVLNGVAMARVRAWNTAYDVCRRSDAAESDTSVPSAPSRRIASRRVWNNPVLWREIRTRAYGRRRLWIRAAYLLLVGLAVATIAPTGGTVTVVGLMVISLLLINAQAVTSVTAERDARTLDLLLVTDLTAREFVFGKLAGALYNSKEIALLPLAVAVYVGVRNLTGAESVAYAGLGWLMLTAFALVLGLHAGMTYAKSNSAIGISLGTIFFLAVGVAVAMRIMLAFSGAFGAQLQPFLVAMVGGGVGLYLALGARNPSPAIAATATILPAATFYAMTSYLLDNPLATLAAVVVAYGFATASMLVPAVHEFDVVTGRAGGEGPGS